jgi:hypothetical protein
MTGRSAKRVLRTVDRSAARRRGSMRGPEARNSPGLHQLKQRGSETGIRQRRQSTDEDDAIAAACGQATAAAIRNGAQDGSLCATALVDALHRRGGPGTVEHAGLGPVKPQIHRERTAGDNPSAQDRKAVEEALAVISMQFAMTARRLRVGMMIAKPCGRVRV